MQQIWYFQGLPEYKRDVQQSIDVPPVFLHHFWVDSCGWVRVRFLLFSTMKRPIFNN